MLPPCFPENTPARKKIQPGVEAYQGEKKRSRGLGEKSRKNTKI
jgi:hypothetical protein